MFPGLDKLTAQNVVSNAHLALAAPLVGFSG